MMSQATKPIAIYVPRLLPANEANFPAEPVAVVTALGAIFFVINDIAGAVNFIVVNALAAVAAFSNRGMLLWLSTFEASELML